MRISMLAPVALIALAACETKIPGGTAANGSAAGNAAAPEVLGNVTAAGGAIGDNTLPTDFAKLPLKEFMGHVIQFSAHNLWKWQGYVADKTGEHSLFPKTDQDWEDAESAGRTLAELTNILLLPGRRVDDPRWAKDIAVVRDVALRSAEAAEKHDEKALFATGSELDEACEQCHIAFMPNYQGPKAAPAADKK